MARRPAVAVALVAVALACGPALPSSARARVAESPVMVQTVPVIEGVRFSLDGREAISNRHGLVVFGATQPGSHLLRLLDVGDSRPGTRIIFSRWSDGADDVDRQVFVETFTFLEVRFDVRYQVSFAFVDGSGEEIDPSRVTSLALEDQEGRTRTISNFTGSWLSDVRSFGEEGDAAPLTYRVSRAVVDGETVTAKVAEPLRPRPGPAFTVEVEAGAPPNAAGVEILVTDALLGRPLSSVVTVEHPDGLREERWAGGDGLLQLRGLPGGSYSTTVDAGLWQLHPERFTLAQGASIRLRVVTAADLVLVALILASGAALVLALRRPGVRSQLAALRSTAGTRLRAAASLPAPLRKTSLPAPVAGPGPERNPSQVAARFARLLSTTAAAPLSRGLSRPRDAMLARLPFGRRTERGPGSGDLRMTFRLLRRFIGGQRRTFTMALVVLVFESAATVFEAAPLAYLIDYLGGDRPDLDLPSLPSGQVSTIAALTLAILLLAMINSAADSGSEILLARGGQTLGYEMRVALFGHLQQLSLAYHDRRRTGDVITRVTGDVKELEEFVTDSVSDLIGSALLLVGVVIFLLTQSWQVAAVGLLMIPVLALVSNYFAVRIKKAAKQQRAHEGDLASTTQEMLTSIRVVQTFGRSARGERRFASESGQAMDAAYETARLEAWFSWIWSTLKALAAGLVVWIGLFVVKLDLGILVMCVILIEEMFKPTRKIIKEWNKIGKLFASAERVAEVLDREAIVKDEPGAVTAPALNGLIELEDLSFAYKLDPTDAEKVVAAGSESRRALENVSLRVSPGEVVALVGHSGAGKSTIAQLVPRLYDPQGGRVLLDGHDVRSFTLESLRGQISVVLQETVLFSGSVADNISYGREAATREEIVAAAKMANAHEFIEEMPDGYDTELSERASNLSGGQRQRLAIARALIRGTSILILDEPTTGLDADSTEIVLSALETLMRGKTTLLISHDLGLIRTADRIVVLRAGVIEQQGTHGELMHEGGLYAHLYSKQFEAEPRSRARSSGDDAKTQTMRLGSPEPVTLPDVGSRSGNGHSNGFTEETVDPLQSSQLSSELPGLAVALDGDAMRDHLEDALMAEGATGWTIERCVPGKAFYVPGEGCLLRYKLELANEAGERRPALVGGRLFERYSEAEAFLHERLEPLSKRVSDREEVSLFDFAVASLRVIPMTVYAFPIDADLPTLVSASDPRHMLEVFQDMPEALGARGSVRDCRVALAHYPRRDHCLLRYELDLRNGSSTGNDRRIVYGKVAGRDWERTGAVLTGLHEHVAANPGRGRFAVPRFFGLRPELNLALIEAIPGEPKISRLIKQRVFGRVPEPGLTLETAIEACGAIVSTLHGASLEVDVVRELRGEVAALSEGVRALREVAPEFAETLSGCLERVEGLHPTEEPPSPRPCHGDFTHSQVVFDDEGESGLLDFDTMCLAEPALDLGHFCAYLRVACRKAERTAARGSTLGDDLCELFLDAYLKECRHTALDRGRLRARMEAFEILVLVRTSLRSWHQLKPARLNNVLSVLQERVECLSASRR